MFNLKVIISILACALFFAVSPANLSADFSGYYEVPPSNTGSYIETGPVGNWLFNINRTPGAGPGATNLRTTNVPTSVQMNTMGTWGFGTEIDLEFIIEAEKTGTITFDWTFSSSGTYGNLVRFGFWNDGVFTDLGANGSETFSIVEGTVFGFGMLAEDDGTTMGDTAISGSATISNFNVVPVPEPGTMLLMGSLLASGAAMRRKRKKC